jgi:hypoxanthine phosphoribosyltransferase
VAGTGARRRYPHPTKSRGRVGSRGPEGGSHPSGYDPAIGAEGPAPLTFDDVARLVVDLAERLRDRHDLMLVITRGGLIPGGILAYLAGYKNIVVAAVEFYDDDGHRGAEPAFHQFPSAELLHGRTVLIVDEVWDSGRTIEAVTRRVREAGGIPTTAVLHYKPGRSEVDARPDHHVVETDDWVVYPWTKVLAYLAVRPGP